MKLCTHGHFFSSLLTIHIDAIWVHLGKMLYIMYAGTFVYERTLSLASLFETSIDDARLNVKSS